MIIVSENIYCMQVFKPLDSVQKSLCRNYKRTRLAGNLKDQNAKHCRNIACVPRTVSLEKFVSYVSVEMKHADVYIEEIR